MPATRITNLFARLKREGRKGFIAYITAGDPAPDRTPALVEALQRGGADLIELGADARAAGIDGCLLTDASVDEAGAYVGVMRAAGLDTVFLAAPTSSPRRLRLVAEYSTGFVYLVSHTGVTGERDSISSAVAPLIRSMREVTDLPLAVGFGVSTPEHVAEIGAQAEAVVVGSAIMRLIEKNADNESLEIQLESFVRELKHGFQVV